ncbi:hypothetical protein NLJ89_g11781 [Agrocybe chaxingu]|uniref:Dihydroxy-acid/6-phosphogluconate dehydratase N-terminal domain-containing protein n=1 Tax=Agrocybe chaxingu TaxID=84603 RepID=A0A9W8JNQ5_9AGAR|nr:hypothetical protein NLJ89_g11781 [Agrocybe chaxingu]
MPPQDPAREEGALDVREMPGEANHEPAMLYATDGIQTDDDFQKAMVGVASVWYEGNPCNKHLLGLGQEIKASLTKSDIIGYQFGTVGVSDGISMGTRGMSFSLQSRDLIADQVETAAGGHHLDVFFHLAFNSSSPLTSL